MENRRKIYVKAANQVSIQQPLSELWMQTPEQYDVPYTRSIDPNFREYLSPLEARRMGKILKRALVVSLKTMRDTQVEHPDAIITGTGLGCIENTEIFLDQLCREGEELLKPTVFMQSTHNTISSLLAIQTKSHGYNVTYSHKGMSFDSALMDAMTQFRLGRITTALVGSHDEMTPSYFTLLQRIGYVGGDMKGVCGEAAVAVMLQAGSDDEVADALCEMTGMKMMYRPTTEEFALQTEKLLADNGLTLADIDAVVTGVNGNQSNDIHYEELCSRQFPRKPLLRYKNLFGECYSASGFALYCGAHCIAKGEVPATMRYGNDTSSAINPRVLLLVNQYDGKNYSITLLRKTCSGN